MKNLKSTVGFVSPEGVILKDHSVFDKGDIVLVISAESFEELFKELSAVKEDLDKSKEWMEEIEKINENNSNNF